MAAYAPASSNSMSWVRALHRYRKGLNSDDEFFCIYFFIHRFQYMKNIFHHLVICNPYEGHQLTSCRSFVAEDQDIYDDVESTLRGDLGNLN